MNKRAYLTFKPQLTSAQLKRRAKANRAKQARKLNRGVKHPNLLT